MLLQSVSAQSPDLRAITPHAELLVHEFCWMACLAGEDGGSIHDAGEIAEFAFLVN